MRCGLGCQVPSWDAPSIVVLTVCSDRSSIRITAARKCGAGAARRRLCDDHPSGQDDDLTTNTTPCKSMSAESTSDALDPPRAARRLFGPLFVATGVLHFLIPRTYEAIVPDYLPAKRALVYASGVAEIAGGAGLIHPRARTVASWWCIATLPGVFPANVHMALHPDRYRQIPGGRGALLA